MHPVGGHTGASGAGTDRRRPCTALRACGCQTGASGYRLATCAFCKRLFPRPSPPPRAPLTQLHKLMLPHFRYTLNINRNARATLVSARGTIETAFSPGAARGAAGEPQLWAACLQAPSEAP